MGGFLVLPPAALPALTPAHEFLGLSNYTGRTHGPQGRSGERRQAVIAGARMTRPSPSQARDVVMIFTE